MRKLDLPQYPTIQYNRIEMLLLKCIFIMSFIASSRLEDRECLMTTRGETYSGIISTAGGRSCKQWKIVSLLNVNIIPDDHRTLPLNYCRNPTDDINGPWCYVSLRGDKASCHIPLCSTLCRQSETGVEYAGNLSVAEDGNRCLDWSILSSSRSYTRRRYRKYLGLKHNYCRNIDGSRTRPWCFTSINKLTYCNVPLCKEQVKCFDGIGMQYEGKQDTTDQNNYCQKWYWAIRPRPSWMTAENLNSKSIYSVRNYCRNPTGDARGPYCYVGASKTCPIGKCKEYCRIPKCEHNSHRISCLEDTFGQTYNGSSSNWKCAHWSNAAVLRSLGKDPVFPLNNSDLSQNFCRNPNKDPKGLYCLAQSKNGNGFEKIYCSVPQCQTYRSIPHNYVAYPLTNNQTCIDDSTDILTETLDVEKTKSVDTLFRILFKNQGSVVLANVKMCKVSSLSKFDWPEGHYCLPFASPKNETCPQGFIMNTTSSISMSFQISSLAAQKFDYRSTGKYLCCRKDGDPLTITLPEQFLANVSHGFGLLSYADSCPPIFNMSFVYTGDVFKSSMRLCIYKQKEKPKPEITSLAFFGAPRCPENHSFMPAPSIVRTNFNLCSHANLTVDRLPPGRYCLAALNSSYDCPRGMLFVKLAVYKACCMDSSSRTERGIWPTNASSGDIVVLGLGGICPDFKFMNKPIVSHAYSLSSYLPVIGQVSRFDVCRRRYGTCRLTLCYYDLPQSEEYEKDYAGIQIRESKCPHNWKSWTFHRLKRLCLVPFEELPMGRFCVYKYRNCPKSFISRYGYCCKSEGIAAKKYEWKKMEKLSFSLKPFGSDCQRFSKLGFTKTSISCNYSPRSPTSVTLLYPISRVYSGRYRVCRRIMGLSLKRPWIFQSRYHTGCLMSFSLVDLPKGEYCFIALSECPEGFHETPYPLRNTYICCQTKDHSNSNSRHQWPLSTERIALYSKSKDCIPLEGFRKGLPYSMPKWSCKNTTSIKCDASHEDFGANQFCYYQRLKVYSSYEVRWPETNFGIPKVLGVDCPNKFSHGKISHEMESEQNAFAHSAIIHLDGIYAIGHQYIEWSFCGYMASPIHPHSKIDDRILESFPDGQYCVAQVGDTCPEGFSGGTLSITEETEGLKSFKSESQNIPRLTRSKNDSVITYYFCCRADIDDARTPILLPTERPFYLFGYGDRCQNVSNTTVSSEYICFDAEDSVEFDGNKFNVPYFTTGNAPVSGSNQRGCDVQVNLCYYTPDNWREIKKPTYIDNQNYSSTFWPAGQYSLFRSIYDPCPPGFLSGQISLPTSMHFTNGDSMHFLSLSYSDQATVINVCTGGPGFEQLSPRRWPPGLYCVIKHERCSPGLEEYPMNLFSGDHTNENAFEGEGTVPLSFRNRNPKLCCSSQRSDEKLRLPNMHPFILIKNPKSPSCPKVVNTHVYSYELEDSNDKLSLTELCYYVHSQSFSSTSWPKGDYYLPIQSIAKCPQGFVEKTRIHEPFNANITDNSVSLKLCHRNSTREYIFTNEVDTNAAWSNGSYCILVPGQSCPIEMKANFMEILTLPGFLCCRDQKNKLASLYTLCCRNQGTLVMNLPNKEPFEIFSPTASCDNVPDMHVSVTQMKTSFTSNQVAYSSVMQFSGVINVCTYTPSSYNATCRCKVKNAICSSDNTCKCAPGYFGDDETFCEPFKSNCNGKCSKNAVCQPTGYIQNGDDSKSHFCQCNEGYEGNGFVCRPSCVTKLCPRHSHCIVDKKSQQSKCVCNYNTLPFEEYCHTDVLETLQNSLHIKQDFTNHLQCLSVETQNKLAGLTNEENDFYLLVVPPQAFNICSQVYEHIVEDFDPEIYLQSPSYTNGVIIQEETLGKTYLNLQYSSNKPKTMDSMRTGFLKINNVSVTKTIPFTNAVLVFVSESLPVNYERYVDNTNTILPDSSHYKGESYNVGKSVGWTVFLLLMFAAIISLYVFWLRGGIGGCKFPSFQRPFYVTDSGSQIIRFATDNIDEIEIAESPNNFN